MGQYKCERRQSYYYLIILFQAKFRSRVTFTFKLEITTVLTQILNEIFGEAVLIPNESMHVDQSAVMQIRQHGIFGVTRHEHNLAGITFSRVCNTAFEM